eukprot:5061907-Amphidinium_carterae.1
MRYRHPPSLLGNDATTPLGELSDLHKGLCIIGGEPGEGQRTSTQPGSSHIHRGAVTRSAPHAEGQERERACTEPNKARRGACVMAAIDRLVTLSPTGTGVPDQTRPRD